MVPNFKEISILSKEMKCISIHCFALTESDIDNAPIAVCRNFVPLYSINEEAATGTSNYALACYLHNLGIDHKDISLNKDIIFPVFPESLFN